MKGSIMRSAAVLAAVVLSVSVLAGCSSNNETADSSDNNAIAHFFNVPKESSGDTVSETASSESASSETAASLQEPSVESASQDPISSAEPEESSKLSPDDEKKLETIRILAEKKNELKDQKNFTFDDKYAMGRCYYCDAVIKDYNGDGTYEMIVKYLCTTAIPESGNDDETSTGNFRHYNVVYDLYTVHDGSAVSSGHLNYTYPFYYTPAF